MKDKTLLGLAALLCGTILGVAALIIDGPQAEQLVTGLVGVLGTAGGYIFGTRKCEAPKEE